MVLTDLGGGSTAHEREHVKLLLYPLVCGIRPRKPKVIASIIRQQFRKRVKVHSEYARQIRADLREAHTLLLEPERKRLPARTLTAIRAWKRHMIDRRGAVRVSKDADLAQVPT